MKTRKVLDLLEDANIALSRVDQMFKEVQTYDEAVIAIEEAMKSIEYFIEDADRIEEEYSESFQYPGKSREIEYYEDKHGK